MIHIWKEFDGVEGCAKCGLLKTIKNEVSPCAGHRGKPRPKVAYASNKPLKSRRDTVNAHFRVPR